MSGAAKCDQMSWTLQMLSWTHMLPALCYDAASASRLQSHPLPMGTMLQRRQAEIRKCGGGRGRWRFHMWGSRVFCPPLCPAVHSGIMECASGTSASVPYLHSIPTGFLRARQTTNWNLPLRMRLSIPQIISLFAVDVGSPSSLSHISCWSIGSSSSRPTPEPTGVT
jgi:hypothetical protein